MGTINKKIKGNAWVGLLLLLVFIITIGLTLLSQTLNTITQTKKAAQITLAQTIADSGVDLAIAKLNQTNGLYGGENNYQISTSGTIDVTVSPTGNPELRDVFVKSYVPSKSNPKSTREVRARVTAKPNGDTISFQYAVQVGDDGLSMNPNSVINGTVFSNGLINGSGTINGDTWANGTITGVTINGSRYTPVPKQPMPSINVEAWKSEANRNNDAITTTTYNQTSGNLGPKRINGNCNFSNIRITGPVYCTGAIEIGGTISIDPSFGSNGTVVLADGAINNNKATILDTGATPKGYVLFITNSTDYNAALTLGTGSSGGVFLAVNGGVTVNPHCTPVIIVAKRFNMNPNSTLTCTAGLGSVSFVNGPGGGWRPLEWQILPLSGN